MDIFLIILAVIIGLFVIVSIGSGIGMFCFALKRPKVGPDPTAIAEISDHMKPFEKFIITEKKWFFENGYEKVEIKSHDGLKLNGSVICPAEPSKKTVLAIHGYKNCGINEYAPYVRMYLEMGFNVVIPDDRAHGESEGKYISFAWWDRRDCISWVNYIIDRFGKDSSVMLHGISMGSATVMNASGEKDLPEQVKAIVSDCGYNKAWNQFAHVLKRNFHLPEFPILQVANVVNRILCKYDFKENNPVDQVKNARVPIMFIHGGDDDFVPTSMVYDVFEACSSDVKELHIFPGAAHAESYYVCHDEYVKALKEFVDKIEF